MAHFPSDLTAWRKAQRAELIARREAIDAATMGGWRRAMDGHLERGFPGLARGVVAFCWPYRNEYDARHLAAQLRGEVPRVVLVAVGPAEGDHAAGEAGKAPLQVTVHRPAPAVHRGGVDRLAPRDQLDALRLAPGGEIRGEMSHGG